MLFAFVVLGLVSSMLSQEIGWRGRIFRRWQYFVLRRTSVS